MNKLSPYVLAGLFAIGDAVRGRATDEEGVAVVEVAQLGASGTAIRRRRDCCGCFGVSVSAARRCRSNRAVLSR